MHESSQRQKDDDKVCNFGHLNLNNNDNNNYKPESQHIRSLLNSLDMKIMNNAGNVLIAFINKSISIIFKK